MNAILPPELQALCRKHLFRLDGYHYLNGAYLSPLSIAVEEAGMAGMQRTRLPTNVKPHHFFDHRNEIRRNYAKLINVPEAQDVAVLASVSYGLAIIAKNTPTKPGQNIVLTGGEFPSNYLIWRRMADERGLDLRMVAQPQSYADRADLWNAALLEAIDENTALISIAAMNWLDGTLFDLLAIGARAREVGAIFVVDGTQSIGAMPFDQQEVQADAVLTCSYKWLTGPYGMAAGWYGPRYINGVPLEEPWTNRVGTEVFSRLSEYNPEYRPGAERFDAGQTSNFILSPMLAAAIGQVLEWGVPNSARYCAALTGMVEAELVELGFEVISPGKRGPHFICFATPAGVSSTDILEALAAKRVAVSARANSIRVTPNVYCDEGDVAALVEALAPFRQRRPVASGYALRSTGA